MRKTFKEIDTTLPTKEQLQEFQPMMTSTNGRRILRSLFLETVGSNVLELGVSRPVFTLKDRNIVKDGITYWSIKNLYFSYDHVPGFEYQFAKDVFGSWEHWQLLVESGDLVREYIEAWRDEMTIRLQARALESLFKTALFEGSKGTPAARYLADRGWEVKRGRPSKDEVEREKKIAAGVHDEVQKDIERLGLALVK
jgi:hypothetical protein